MKTPGKLTWSQKWRFGSDASPFPSGVIFFSGWENISPILVGENNSSNVCFNEELLGNDDFYTATFSFFLCFSFSAFLPTRCFHLSKQQQIVLQKKLRNWPSFWGSLSKNHRGSLWWLQKTTATNKKRCNCWESVCQVGKSGLTCWWLACG